MAPRDPCRAQRRVPAVSVMEWAPNASLGTASHLRGGMRGGRRSVLGPHSSLFLEGVEQQRGGQTIDPVPLARRCGDPRILLRLEDVGCPVSSRGRQRAHRQSAILGALVRQHELGQASHRSAGCPRSLEAHHALPPLVVIRCNTEHRAGSDRRPRPRRGRGPRRNRARRTERLPRCELESEPWGQPRFRRVRGGYRKSGRWRAADFGPRRRACRLAQDQKGRTEVVSLLRVT
jgi:hypothetical protein